MMKLKTVVFGLLVIAGVCWSDVTENTTLISTFMVHRHGDRTPVENSLFLTTDPEAVAAASAPYGYGQLTDVGMRRSYYLGETIRARYSELLSPQYNQSEIYIRSTDSTRAKMTVLTAMAAVFPSYQGSWSRNVNWVPVPYTTVPAKYDFMLSVANCPALSNAFFSLFYSDTNRLEQYNDTLSVVADVYGSDVFKTYPVLIYAVYDAVISQKQLGVPVDPRIEAILDDLKAAAGEAINIIFGDEATINLEAGVLLNEFFTYADKVIDGQSTPRVRIYSAHDLNVFAFSAVSQITPRQGVPPYASYFALELRKDRFGQYVVLPVYQSSPGEDVLYLPVEGCSSLLCNIDEFYSIVSPYLLDEDTWRTDCGFTNDLDVDDGYI